MDSSQQLTRIAGYLLLPKMTKTTINVLAGNAGAKLVYETAGMHASLLGCCYESFVIDNDMLGAV